MKCIVFVGAMALSVSAPAADHLTIRAPFGPTGGADAAFLAQIAIDADFEFFLHHASDVEQTLAAIESVINPVDGIFQAGPAIAFKITGVIIRTDPNDPYTSNDAAVLLGQVKAEWNSNQPDIEWDGVQLFSGKDLNGATLGIAGLNSICTDNSVSVVALSALELNNQIHLAAHQLGHIFGAADCVGPGCGVMCPIFGGCDGDPLVFGPEAIEQMLDLIDQQGDCLEPISACFADCNADAELNVLDFVCYQNTFSSGSVDADCNADGALNILDFICFQAAFQAGCS